MRAPVNRLEERETTEVESLVAEAQAGSSAAFETLYRVHRAGIYTLLRHLVRDPELAADLTQQTFVRAWESLSRLRHPGAFRGWLHRIALNLVRDEAKAGHTRLEVTEAALGSAPGSAREGRGGGANPQAEVLSSELRKVVQAALAALPAEQRAVVVMHHLEGMSVDEIARVVGVRPGTVMSRLARAREAMRERLRPYLEEGDE